MQLDRLALACLRLFIDIALPSALPEILAGVRIGSI
jgi:ABC-type nitrate/sulfonate/bicarbonate transport system permease component